MVQRPPLANQSRPPVCYRCRQRWRGPIRSVPRIPEPTGFRRTSSAATATTRAAWWRLRGLRTQVGSGLCSPWGTWEHCLKSTTALSSLRRSAGLTYRYAHQCICSGSISLSCRSTQVPYPTSSLLGGIVVLITMSDPLRCNITATGLQLVVCLPGNTQWAFGETKARWAALLEAASPRCGLAWGALTRSQGLPLGQALSTGTVTCARLDGVRRRLRRCHRRTEVVQSRGGARPDACGGGEHSVCRGGTWWCSGLGRSWVTGCAADAVRESGIVSLS